MRNQQTRREAGEQESLHQQRSHDYWLQQILCKSVKTRVNKSENQGPSLGARWTGIAILQSIQSPFLWAVSEQWVAGSRTGLNEWSRNQSLKPSWVKLQFSSVTSRPPLIRSSMYLPSFFYFFPFSSQRDLTRWHIPDQSKGQWDLERRNYFNHCPAHVMLDLSSKNYLFLLLIRVRSWVNLSRTWFVGWSPVCL